MIPLSRWLQEDRAQAAPSLEHQPHEKTFSAFAPEGGGHPVEVTVNDTSGRVAELESQVAELHLRWESDRLAAAARETQLTEQLSGGAASQFADQVKVAFADLQFSIEQAVFEALVPFLNLEVSRKATSELLVLLQKAQSESADPLFEIRAPLHLIEHLRSALSRDGLSLTLQDGPEVELVFRSASIRFEELAARWIDALKGPAS